MKDIKVLKEFHDKDNFSKVYSVGKVYQFEAERAENIVARGLGEYVKNDESSSIEETPTRRSRKQLKAI